MQVLHYLRNFSPFFSKRYEITLIKTSKSLGYLGYFDDIIGILRIAEDFQKVKIAAAFVFILHIVLIGLDALFPAVELVIGTVFPAESEKIVAFKTYP